MTEGSSSSLGFWHVLTQQLKLSDVLNERNLIPHISNITIAQTKDINHHNMMFSFKNHIRFGVVQKQAREGGSRGNLVLLLEPESVIIFEKHYCSLLQLFPLEEIRMTFQVH